MDYARLSMDAVQLLQAWMVPPSAVRSLDERVVVNVIQKWKKPLRA